MGAKGADARRLFVRIFSRYVPNASLAFPHPSFFSPRGVVGASWWELFSQIFFAEFFTFLCFFAKH